MAVGLVLAVAVEPGPGPASGGPGWRGLVMVLSPAAPDDLTRNALARVSGELAAAPFQVIPATIDPAVDLMTQVETAGDELAAVAAFAIRPEPGSERVTIWVSNRISRTTTMQMMQIHKGEGGGDRAAARLAVEAVELVRASLPGLWPEPRSSPTAVTAPSSAPDAEALPPTALKDRRAMLDIGAGLLQELGDAPTVVVPRLALLFGRPDGIGFRLSASGLGPGAEVTRAEGTARIERLAITLALVRLFRSSGVVQPLISLGLGLHHLRARGTSPMPALAHDRQLYSALVAAGSGLAVRLGSRVSLVVEIEALLFWPQASVQVGSAEAADFSGLTVFSHAGLLATF
jgi:hypothetical protein